MNLVIKLFYFVCITICTHRFKTLMLFIVLYFLSKHFSSRQIYGIIFFLFVTFLLKKLVTRFSQSIYLDVVPMQEGLHHPVRWHEIRYTKRSSWEKKKRYLVLCSTTFLTMQVNVYKVYNFIFQLLLFLVIKSKIGEIFLRFNCNCVVAQLETIEASRQMRFWITKRSNF